MSDKHIELISLETGISNHSVKNTLSLLSDGATIPFIARYRKEFTGSLDEVQVANIQKVNKKLLELEERKNTIINSIKEQNKLTPELESKILNCYNLQELEDIYLPYKKKKKTKGDIAKEQGLEPLAKIIMQQRNQDIESIAMKYLNGEITDIKLAIKGAEDIIAEWANEDQVIREKLREKYRKQATVTSKVISRKKDQAQKYLDYFDFSEPLARCPSHRYLALMRGENEGLLKFEISIEKERALETLERRFIRSSGQESKIIASALEDSWKRLIAPSIETQIKNEYKEKADDEAIKVFVSNLEQLLLASPLGEKAILGIDPGYRTGCKVICIDQNGNLLDNDTIYPHPPQNQVQKAAFLLRDFVSKYKISAIGIGDGTAARETEDFVRSLNLEGNIEVYMVNENGASIYSASEIAREEFPDKDITVRGAVSIARRLMDPLAELVKIDAKSIGVGQYQHDVHQGKLKESLDQTVSSCVNRIGININTASKQLLTFVSGLGPALAQNIVEFRKENGDFLSRKALKDVPRLGDKAFEQCAGFLRIKNSKNPLDNTGVHPESYVIVEKMAKDLKTDVTTLIKDKALRSSVKLENYKTDSIGMPTLKDILKELDKPGVDPRGKAREFQFDPYIKDIKDVKEGMLLPGLVTNITKFGAFVNIGVKQDGMVHISQISNQYIASPADVLKLSQEVLVKVLNVDVERKRINLSMLT